MKISSINTFGNSYKLPITKQKAKNISLDCQNNNSYDDVKTNKNKINSDISFRANDTQSLSGQIFLPHFDSNKSIDQLMFFVNMNSRKTYRQQISNEYVKDYFVDKNGELNEDALQIYSFAYKKEIKRAVYQQKAVSDYVYHVMQETKDIAAPSCSNRPLKAEFFNNLDDYFLSKDKKSNPSSLDSKTIYQHMVEKDRIDADMMSIVSQIESEKNPILKFNRAATLSLRLNDSRRARYVADNANRFALTTLDTLKTTDGSYATPALEFISTILQTYICHLDCLDNQPKFSKAVQLINNFPFKFTQNYVKSVAKLIGSFDKLPDNFDDLFYFYTMQYQQNPFNAEDLQEATSGIIQYADGINQDYYDVMRCLFNPFTGEIDMEAYKKMKQLLEYSDLLPLTNSNGELNSSDSTHFSEQKRLIEKYFENSKDIHGKLKTDLPDIKEFVDKEFGKN